MARRWIETIAVLAMVLGLIALAAISLAAMLAAATVFLCVAALLYVVNPAGMRAALKVVIDKPETWLGQAREWTAALKDILASFEEAVRNPDAARTDGAAKAGQTQVNLSVHDTDKQTEVKTVTVTDEKTS